jgi:hypothetical protein
MIPRHQPVRQTRPSTRPSAASDTHGPTEDDVRAVIALAAASAGEELPPPSPIAPNIKVA